MKRGPCLYIEDDARRDLIGGFERYVLFCQICFTISAYPFWQNLPCRCSIKYCFTERKDLCLYKPLRQPPNRCRTHHKCHAEYILDERRTKSGNVKNHAKRWFSERLSRMEHISKTLVPVNLGRKICPGPLTFPKWSQDPLSASRTMLVQIWSVVSKDIYCFVGLCSRYPHTLFATICPAIVV